LEWLQAGESLRSGVIPLTILALQGNFPIIIGEIKPTCSVRRVELPTKNASNGKSRDGEHTRNNATKARQRLPAFQSVESEAEEECSLLSIFLSDL
jgi:hypothetical protein